MPKKEKKVKKLKTKSTKSNNGIKNKNKINIKINVNGASKQPHGSSQPIITTIQPIQPLQNSNHSSLMDNQYGLGMNRELDALRGSANAVKLENDELRHNINNERREREALTRMAINRFHELQSQINSPSSLLTNNDIPSSDSSFLTQSSHPMESNNTSVKPKSTLEYSTPHIRIIPKMVKRETIDHMKIEQEKEIKNADKFALLSQKLIKKNNQEKAVKQKYDADRYRGDITNAKMAVQRMTKKRNESNAFNAIKEVYMKSILNKEKKTERELKKLHEDIPDNHKIIDTEAQPKKRGPKPKQTIIHNTTEMLEKQYKQDAKKKSNKM